MVEDSRGAAQVLPCRRSVLEAFVPRSLAPTVLCILCTAGTDCFLLESIFRTEVWEHMQLPISEDNERSCYQVHGYIAGREWAGRVRRRSGCRVRELRC